MNRTWSTTTRLVSIGETASVGKVCITFGAEILLCELAADIAHEPRERIEQWRRVWAEGLEVLDRALCEKGNEYADCPSCG